MYDTELINKWVLFGFNYPYNFIKRCWADEPDHFIQHLENKFENSCSCNMNHFFVELDSENQNRLVEWFKENY